MAIQTPPEPPKARPDYRNAKADAKPATAYATSQRPWYKKKRFIVSIAAILFIMIMIVAVAGSGGTDSTSTSTPDNGNDTSGAPTAQADESTSQAPVAATGATAKLPIQNGDWRLNSVRVSDDGLGDFGATARVTYTGGKLEGGTNVFTLTVFAGGKDVAALTGSANAVMSGWGTTVQFVSQDEFVGGPYKYELQHDL